MKDMEVQTTVFSIIIVTLFMAALLFYLNKKMKEYDPLSQPRGAVLLLIN